MNGRRIRYCFLLVLLLLLLSACSGPTERLWLNAPGWRRALRLGTTAINDPVPVVTDDQGDLYFLLMQEGEGVYPQVVSLDRQAQERWRHTFDLSVSLPNEPGLTWTQDHLQLFWLGGNGLYSAALDRAGEVVAQPTLLSGEQMVGDYAVARHPGGAPAIWYAGPRREPGLWALNPEEGVAAQLVDPLGIRPALFYDEQGNLHAAWIQYEQGGSEVRLYYAIYPDGRYDPEVEPTLVTSSGVGITSIFSGPYLGLTDETTYLLWTLEFTTGMEAGSARTEYVSFPTGQPEQVSEAQLLGVPSDFDLEYVPVNGELAAGPRVPLPGGYIGPFDLAPNPARTGSELVVAARATVEYRLRKTASQATTIFFEDGEPTGYQLLSFSRIPSSSPYVISDETGALYSTWLETGPEGNFHVYFASTAGDLLAELGDVTSQDILALTAETVFGMLTGAILAPFAGFLWLLLPLVILALTGFFRRESERTIGVGMAISLFLAVAAFWLVKLGTLGATDYVPFSAWIPFLPVWLGTPLRLGFSLLVLVTALAAAWYYTFRRGTQSALYFILIYAAVDSVMTLAVYGVIIYGFI